MSKIHNKCSDDTHRQLVGKFEEASLNTVLKDDEIPEFDLSFLDEQNEKCGSESGIKETRKRINIKFSRIITAAACVIIILLSANIILIATDSTDTYGDRGILHRLKTSVNGLFTDEETVDEDGIRESISINNMQDIDKAKKFLPQLYIPEYIPEGYELEQLTIDEYYSGDYLGEYIFVNDDNQQICIALEYIAGNTDYSNSSEGSLIDMDDRKIYITESEAQEEFYADVYTEECAMYVTGNIAQKEDIIKIAETLNK